MVKTREYQLPKGQGYKALRFTESKTDEMKGTDVLVKIHAVSLQVCSHCCIFQSRFDIISIETC